MIFSRKVAKRSIENKVNAKSKEETVYLYADIGGYWGIDHQEWIKDFNALDSKVIHLRVDSGGGDIFAARAMKTAIMQHDAKVIAHIDGLAASAASFLVMGADEVEMVDGGFLMIHKAMSFMDIFGYYNDAELNDLVGIIGKEQKLHEKLNESIANDYAKKTGGTKTEYLSLMTEETWFSATEALEKGLVDSVYDGDVVEGSYDLSVYTNVPDSINADNSIISKRKLEKVMRDAGVSSKEAKRVLAEGFEGKKLRDEVDPVDPIAPKKPEAAIQRDVEPVGKDKTSELLSRAEKIAPSISTKTE